MNRNKFKFRDLAETIALLCEVKGAPIFKNGEVVQSALARETGVIQPAISRHLSGMSKEMSYSNIAKLAKYFGVTISQMVGETPIPSIDGGVDDDILSFIEKLNELTQEQRDDVLAICQVLAKKNQENEKKV